MRARALLNICLKRKVLGAFSKFKTESARFSEAKPRNSASSTPLNRCFRTKRNRRLSRDMFYGDSKISSYNLLGKVSGDSKWIWTLEMMRFSSKDRSFRNSKANLLKKTNRTWPKFMSLSTRSSKLRNLSGFPTKISSKSNYPPPKIIIKNPKNKRRTYAALWENEQRIPGKRWPNPRNGANPRTKYQVKPFKTTLISQSFLETELIAKENEIQNLAKSNEFCKVITPGNRGLF